MNLSCECALASDGIRNAVRQVSKRLPWKSLAWENSDVYLVVTLCMALSELSNVACLLTMPVVSVFPARQRKILQTMDLG